MAKDWMSQAEMQKDSAIYAAWVLVLAGVAVWDILRTLPFDLSIISGRRKWRWPMALYFANRVWMLIHVFSYSINLNAISWINCDVVTWLCKLSDMLGTITSSLILALRTTAIWHQDKRVAIPLALGYIVSIVLWCQTMRYSHSIWNTTRHVCQIMSTSPSYLLITVWSWTMVYDFVITVLAANKLWRTRGTSGIGSILLRDGIAYFAVTFSSNVLQTTLGGLGLNPVMNIISIPFVLVVSVIASTTVFRNVFTLYDDFGSDGAPTSRSATSYGQSGPAVTFGGTPLNRTPGKGRFGSKQHDTFAMSELQSTTTQIGNFGGIEVHQVVDIERDAESTFVLPYDHKEPVDDDHSSMAEREEKHAHAT